MTGAYSVLDDDYDAHRKRVQEHNRVVERSLVEEEEDEELELYSWSTVATSGVTKISKED